MGPIRRLHGQNYDSIWLSSPTSSPAIVIAAYVIRWPALSFKASIEDALSAVGMSRGTSFNSVFAPHISCAAATMDPPGTALPAVHEVAPYCSNQIRLP